MKHLLTIFFLISSVAANDTSLTIYSSADPASFEPQQFVAGQRLGNSLGNNPNIAYQVPGFGVVKEVRELELKEGANAVRFSDVAQYIDPTTVSIVDLSPNPSFTLLDQSFEFDLVSSHKLLEKYLDQNVTASVVVGNQKETHRGTLLSANYPHSVIKTPTGIQLLSNAQYELGELPQGLITKPTLVLNIAANSAGKRNIRSTYQTGGLTWRADYSLILANDEKTADVSAWVTAMNLSGASYPNTKLKLIAGDVQRIKPGRNRGHVEELRMADFSADSAGFEEKPFFEYHLYSLPRRIDLLMNSVRQITLFPAAKSVGVTKQLVYYGLPEARHWSFLGAANTDRNLGNDSNKKVDVYVRLKNEAKNELGIPLPKGKVRVYKEDSADGTVEFIGEDLIDHTPKDEELLIKVGQSFDVVGDRVIEDFKLDSSRKTMSETIALTVKNHKDSIQSVTIRETLYRWNSWEIATTDKFEKIDARTIHFEVDLPANSEKTVRYTVNYSW